MSIIFLDPRTKTKYRYLFINSTGNKEYTPRGPNLLKLDEYFDSLFNTCVLFNNELTDTNKLDIYSITIYNILNNIINNQLKPCANSTSIDKCDCISTRTCSDNDLCIYTIEIQFLIAEYTPIFYKMTVKDIKKKYEFLANVSQNYTAAAVTIPINKVIGTTNNYNLCGGTTFITSTVTDPELIAKYNDILLNINKNIIQTETNVQNINTQNTIISNISNVVIVIVIIVIIYFSWKFLSNLIKNISKKKS